MNAPLTPPGRIGGERGSAHKGPAVTILARGADPAAEGARLVVVVAAEAFPACPQVVGCRWQRSHGVPSGGRGWFLFISAKCLLLTTMQSLQRLARP